MTQSNSEPYRPACRSAQPGACSGCGLAFDCQRAQSGRVWAWPLVAIVLIGAVAVLT
jgi:hypothetical protein